MRTTLSLDPDIATTAKQLPGEGFKRSWPPRIKLDAVVCRKLESFLNALAADGRPRA